MTEKIQLTQLPALSLYIHMPWCIQKCPYCDFNSHQLRNELPEKRYIDCLIQDLELNLPDIWGRTVNTIFIGGGTPSLFSGTSIDYLLSQIRARVNLSPFAEITLEANPGTVEQNYIAEYKAAGINRISLGIQSFNDTHLKALGRIHNSHEAIKAIELVAKYFDNFNLDIIYGLPEQTIEQALSDITTAISFNPTHLSAYNLTIEPNTAFATSIPSGIPDDDICYEMQDAINQLLAENNYLHYEVSAFAKANHQSQHNLNYWQFGDYLGIGAGAHAKISFHDRIIRQARYKHPEEYMQHCQKGSQISEQRSITTKELQFEFMLNALRLVGGFESKLFSQTTGLNLGVVLPILLKAQDEGLINLMSDRITPTKFGQNFLNTLLEKFLD